METLGKLYTPPPNPPTTNKLLAELLGPARPSPRLREDSKPFSLGI